MTRATVVIFIDALGNEVATHHGFLSERPGVRTKLETVIGYSSSAIPSLLTGQLPRAHGHFSMYRRDRGDGVFAPFKPLMWLAHHTKGRGKVRALLKRRLSARLTGYFELYDIPLNVLSEFDLCQRHDLFRPGGVPGFTTVFDTLDASGVPHRVWTWRDEERGAFEALTEAVRSGEGGFHFLYSARLDALMHDAGTGDVAVHDRLGEYEERIRAIADGFDGECHVLVFSDHGMTDVTGVHDVHAMLGGSGLSFPRDALVFTDSTMARFWFRRPGAESAVRRALPDCEWGRWLSEADERRFGVDFEDHRYGEALFVLEAGHVIAPSFMGDRACAAMHGYAPEHPSTDAWLYRSHPGGEPPASILDLKRVLEAEIAWLGEGERS